MPLVLSPIPGWNAYFGVAPETTPGTPVAPSKFFHWMDGTTIEIDMTAENIMEDATRYISMIIKNKQMVKLKLTTAPRSDDLGYLEAMALGAGSDTYTVPSVSTTLSANTAIGATSITVPSNASLGGSGTAAMCIGAGTSSEEVAIFNLPATGSGPYTLTVSSTYNSGTLKRAHSIGDTVQEQAEHTLTDKPDGNYYTIEMGLGSLYGFSGTTIRVRSCKVETIKRSSKAGGILIYEVELFGIACAVQSTPATVTLENRQPFLFTQSIGAWNIGGSTTSTDAQAIEAWDIEQKNNLDTSIQAESLTLSALMFTSLDIGLGYDFVFTNTSKIYEVYFGSSTGTADAQQIYLESFSVTFTQPDTFQSVTYTINTVAYTKAPLPPPKKKGDHFKVSVSGTSQASTGGPGPNNSYLLQVVVNNMHYSQYQ